MNNSRFEYTGDSRYTRFRYPRFYFSITRSINIPSAIMVEAATQAPWLARAISLTRPTILTPGNTNQCTCFQNAIKLSSPSSGRVLTRQAQHQYLISGQVLKRLRRTFSRLIRECDADDKLSTKEFWRHLTSKWRLLRVSRFTHFRYTRRFEGTQSPCITRATCSYFCWDLNRHTPVFLELLRSLFWNFSGVYLWVKTRYWSLTVMHSGSCCRAPEVIHLATSSSRQPVLRRCPYCLHTDMTNVGEL
jgi:hypothetical protein